jgi:hypothetical protein
MKVTAALVVGTAVVAAQNMTTIPSVVIQTSNEVVLAYTTYRPLATAIVENNQAITVTEATTLTLRTVLALEPRLSPH